MILPIEPKILPRTRQSEFVGRSLHVAQLMQHAAGPGGGIAVLVRPLAGTSELLRHVYDRLFNLAGDIVPFYFEFRTSDRDAKSAAMRLVHDFLVQTIAFRRSDRRVIDASPCLSEIGELAPPSDSHWIDQIIEAHRDTDSAERSFVRASLSVPLRAAANGVRSAVMLDGLDSAMRLEHGSALIEDVVDIFSRADIPVVVAGQRRFLYGRTPFRPLIVDSFTFDEAGKFIEMLSAKTGVAINDQTRDLIAVQLGGCAGHISSIFAAASAEGLALTSFDEVQRVYTDELFGGRISRYFDAVLGCGVNGTGSQRSVLSTMRENLNSPGGRIPEAYWRKNSGLTNHGSQILHSSEIIDLSSGLVAMDRDDIVLTDYVRGRVHIELDSRSRALAVGDAMSHNLKRSPKLMARHYRRSTALGLRGLLDAFDGRQVSSALIDYGRFKTELKGAPDDKILKSVREDNEAVSLPSIVYTARTSTFYPKLDELCDPERSASAFGFLRNDQKDETVWLAAEIESKLEAAKDIVDFWCDRLEMVAVASGFSKFQIWLIAPEGFSPEALDVLRERNAFGSSRKQVELLAGLLNAQVNPSDKPDANQYEIVIPMGPETEMIAAHTVEEVAKRHGFPPRSVNQIKTALVEACINASEHSHSPDRRIYQKFNVDSDKLTITVSNRGVRLADKEPARPQTDEGRRGWGLKLIRGLMDEVYVETTDDGTRITMVKYLASANA